MTEARPAVLVAGGIEAAHVLAGRGITPIVVSQGSRSYAASSRSVSQSLIAPKGWGTDFDAWFDAQPWPSGAVMIPGHDDSAWWLARRSTEGNASNQALATPGLPAIRSLLMKSRLAALCGEHSVPAPRTWLAEENGIPTGMSTPRFPLVIKPQSRVGLHHWTRGRLVRNYQELEKALAWFRETVRVDDRIVADDPLAVHPVIQEFVVRPRNQVYHLVGYRSREGESVVAAHRKLLQYPLRFGSGLCFESATVDLTAAADLERLLAGAGYHGTFEAEYVEQDGAKLLIDLNPRSYNGILLEAERGYALPWYLYLDTIGEHGLLGRELATARSLNPPEMVWRDGVRFWTMLAGQTLSGGLPIRESARWVRWSVSNRRRMVDPFFIRGDRRVGLAHLGHHLASAVREPRAFLGTYVRRGLDR